MSGLAHLILEGVLVKREGDKLRAEARSRGIEVPRGMISPKAIRSHIDKASEAISSSAKAVGRNAYVQEAAKFATTTDVHRVARAAADPGKTVSGAKRAISGVAEAVGARRITIAEAKTIAKHGALAAGGIKGGAGLAILAATTGSAVVQAVRSGKGFTDAFSEGAYQGVNYIAGGGLDTYRERRAQGDSVATSVARGAASMVDTRLLGGIGQTIKDMTVGRDKPVEKAGGELEKGASKIAGLAGKTAGKTGFAATVAIAVATDAYGKKQAEMREAVVLKAGLKMQGPAQGTGKTSDAKPDGKAPRTSYVSPITGRQIDATEKQQAAWRRRIDEPNKDGTTGAPDKIRPRKD